uniref:P-type ATPase C-terminal domain-containing protein n=1 Tax=Aegilops tauschii subsp. strangulata TaxID=200361 RepID=A0A452ZF10_AEGTS
MVETLKCTEILMVFDFCFSFLADFRFLKRLILVHGRYSHNRTAFLSQYSFYKSLSICFIQILLSHKQSHKSLFHLQILYFFFCFSYCRTSLFNSVSWMAYNVFYASIPVLTTALDKDLSEKTVAQNPEILLYCQAGRLLIQVLLLVGLVDHYIIPFTFLQFLAIWGNFAAFYYIINFCISSSAPYQLLGCTLSCTAFVDSRHTG